MQLHGGLSERSHHPVMSLSSRKSRLMARKLVVERFTAEIIGAMGPNLRSTRIYQQSRARVRKRPHRSL